MLSVSSSGQRHHHSMNAANFKGKVGLAGQSLSPCSQAIHKIPQHESKLTKCVLQQLRMSRFQLLTQNGARSQLDNTQMS